MPLDPVAACVATERGEQPHRVAKPTEREGDIRGRSTDVPTGCGLSTRGHDVDEGLTDEQDTIGWVRCGVGAACLSGEGMTRGL